MRTLLLILSLTLISSGLKAQMMKNGDGYVFKVEDFETCQIGGLPEKWYNQRGDGQPYSYDTELRNTYKYAVTEEDGNKFLRFEGRRGKHLNFPFVDKEDVDITKTPILTWKWRIREVPKGAREDDKEKNDVAASIYVVFDMGKVALFKKVPKSIRYTWSSSLPEGKRTSKLFGNQQIIVVGSGIEGIGEWQTFERNIVEDYKRVFGDDPPKKPLAILILSDADDTKSTSRADYDDIYLKSINE